MRGGNDAFFIALLIVALIWIAWPLLAVGGLEWWHRRRASRARPVVAMIAIGAIWGIVTLLAVPTLFGFGF